MQLGEQRRGGCPYHFCSAVLTTYVTQREYGGRLVEMIPMHELKNDKLPPETCIASLMAIPLSNEEMALLRARERSDYNKLIEIMRVQIRKSVEPPGERPPPSRSRSLRGPHRMGREPVTEQDEDDWQRGGRAGEAVAPEPKTAPPVAPTVRGYSQTGRSSMSVAGVKALIAGAVVEANGGYGALQEIEDEYIQAAQAAVNEMVDRAARAGAAMDDAANSIYAANEEGSDELSGIGAQYTVIGDHLQGTLSRIIKIRESLVVLRLDMETSREKIAANNEAAEQYAAGL